MSRILNNTKALIFIIAVLLIANLAILVFFLGAKRPPSRDERGGSNRDRPGLTEFLKKEIKFSPEQLKQYDSLKKIHWKIARPLFKGINVAKDSFYIHIMDSVINDQVLMSAADSIAIKQRQMDLHMFSHFRNIRNLCTDEQKPLYDSLVQDMIRKMMNPFRRDNHQKRPDHDHERKANDSTRERR